MKAKFRAFDRELRGLAAWLLPAALMAMTAGTMRADELYLPNGDHLTGQLVRRGEGKIYFRSAFLGEITVAENDAVVVEAALPAAKRSSDGKSAAPGTAEQTPQPGLWKAKVEFGFLSQSGRVDTQNLHLRANVERTEGRDSYRFDGRYLYLKSNGVLSADRDDLSFRWRRELSGRVFVQALTTYGRDNVKLIDYDYTQNIGMGYKLVQRAQQTVSVGSGVAAQYRSAFGIENGLTCLGQVFEDYVYKINDRLSLTQESDAQYSPASSGRFTVANGQLVPAGSEAQNYKLGFHSALQGMITKALSLNLRFEYEYDNAVLDRAARADQRVTSTLGYSF